MISRVAECCYWLFRYVERVESTSRLLRVNRSFALDAQLPSLERFRPLIIVSGEEKRFTKLLGADAANDRERVHHFLAWDNECPVSIISSIRWARENARTIREVISVDMWESLNGFWHWMATGEGKGLYYSNPDDFYRWARDWPHEFYGIAHSTLLHDEAFDFMRLGMHLERVGQTARLLDVKHHMLAAADDTPSIKPLENAVLIELLHGLSAHDAYRRHTGGLSARGVMDFVLLEPAFPRSVVHNLEQAWTILHRLSGFANAPDSPANPYQLIEDLRDRVRAYRGAELNRDQLHAELTDVVDQTTAIGIAIGERYFARETPKKQSQSQTQTAGSGVSA
ncbi:MAG: alpha-E domain-containing protein [Phycisphaeraceae bacterium]